ncbi:Fc receptor-like protein 4 [Willisornis vidua]|uniref:Fc receptor-like protein 4 n=1 Tax=Willisornis vidua TaxID=1566151 RepID=A0ABQ9DME2_9PASS|nr:Fc receptor-like protein 4 [Willisornis vidua]KAJ7423548.1 Fc receptor-like protein 4 [Willisornis vidua]
MQVAGGPRGMAGNVELLLLGPSSQSQCDGPLHPAEGLVLQAPARALLEGDTVTLRCRGWRDTSVTQVRFYHEEKELGGHRGTELALTPLQLHHSGRYRCEGWVDSTPSPWKSSLPVTVTVRELFPVPVLEGPSKPTEGSALNLNCISTPSPLRPQAPLLHLFYRDGVLVGGPQVSSQLWLPAVGVSHSGNYTCEVRSEVGTVRKSSSRLRVSVRMPVANATITPGPPSLQVWVGDPVTLHCSVQVGSAPVTFTWLWDGKEVSQGPLLALGNVELGHSGNYQCVATNQLDGHRVFQSLSPALNLTVTPKGQGTGTRQTPPYPCRPIPDPTTPTEDGEVLYTHVVFTEWAGRIPQGASCTVTPQGPHVTYMELLGPSAQLQNPNDLYETVA